MRNVKEDLSALTLLLILAVAIWFSVAALPGCASQPTATDAAALVALELAKGPRLDVVLDTETTELWVNGARSGRLGSCRRLPEGGREITIYVARHGSLGQLAETIRHEVEHARRGCSERDHGASE